MRTKPTDSSREHIGEKPQKQGGCLRRLAIAIVMGIVLFIVLRPMVEDQISPTVHSDAVAVQRIRDHLSIVSGGVDVERVFAFDNDISVYYRSEANTRATQVDLFRGVISAIPDRNYRVNAVLLNWLGASGTGQDVISSVQVSGQDLRDYYNGVISEQVLYERAVSEN